MYMPYDSRTEFSSLVGKTITKIENKDNEELVFHTDDGVYRMLHEQDCCELVRIDDINGDLNDLLNSPVIRAEENTSTENPPGVAVPSYQESFTWTFYRLATAKGLVVIRWYGESNGYYSESVDLYRGPKLVTVM